MSYFDDNNYNGGDASDEENDKKEDDSSSESETIESSDNEEIEEINEENDEENDEDEENDDDDDDDDEDIVEDVAEGSQKGGRKFLGGDLGSSSDEEDVNSDNEEDVVKATSKKTKKIPTKQKAQPIIYDEEDDEDPTGEVYLQKFDKEINDNYLVNFHPESALHNYDEILAMSNVVRDKNGIIIDDLHKTIPYITKYEKARILGQRAKQINSGATVFVKVPEKVIDGYLIAELELQEKRIPFIIRRPLPNGGSEYWSIKDLENISF
jgi:DNA-directed RNA polymerase I, II, and III subunit RPABC2